ncbi:CBS domain-containing protein [Hyalangium sp.]|uniref:CBS domain-containing protein n=1 Tax=Hyalangium sp. TaxID=2028555 RepID=UPI002D6F8318|nr:CBS domain-containing protein [Hyalangium sp.]HYH96798.1 CBS domain-containing protein [Hyalangium sp.]
MTHAIESFMTRSVHTIGTKSPLAEAHRMMNDHGIRHLPVLEGGRLVGMVSQRDLHLIETLKDVDPKEVLVEEAMSQDAYTVAPEAPLAEVAREMARHKYGSAVIVRGAEVLGIFTTTDALLALDTVLTAPKKAVARKASKSRKAGASKTRKGSGQAARRSRR